MQFTPTTTAQLDCPGFRCLRDWAVFRVRDDPEPDCEVRDINKIKAVIPELENYIQRMKSLCPPDLKPIDSKVKSHMETILSDLIVAWITKDSPDLNWRTRDAAVHKGRRQQLLREQGMLDLLVQITQAKPLRELGITYENMAQPESSPLDEDVAKPELTSSMANVGEVCWMSNRLMQFAVAGNTENSLYMIPHIGKYAEQIGAGNIGKSAMEILRVLHVNNRELLEDLPVTTFAQWTDMVQKNLRDNTGSWVTSPIVGRLSVPIRFLADTCICYNEPVRKNQVAICECLFADQSEPPEDEKIDKKPGEPSWVYSRAVLEFESEGSVVSVKDISGKVVKKRFLGEVFSDTTEEAKEMQEYIVASIRLYANLCAKNEDCQEHVKRLMPREMVQNIIMKDDSGTELVRAACCDLLYRLYIDAEQQQPIPSIETTRIFEDIVPMNAHKLVLRDDIPFPELKRWIVTFLSARVYMTASKAKKNDNVFVCSVCKLILNLLDFGVYKELPELEDVLRPLLGILDVHTDSVDPEEFPGDGPNGEDPRWRERATIGSNVEMVKVKTEVCKILAHVQKMALNLRITKMLLAFSEDLKGFEQPDQTVGTFHTNQLQAFIRRSKQHSNPRPNTASSKLKGATDWSKVEKKMKEVKDMFNLLNFNQSSLRDPKVVKSTSFANDLLELSLIPDPELQKAVFTVLTAQYSQRVNLATELRQVQLLCSKDDVQDFQKYKSFLAQITTFLDSPRLAADEKKCAENVLSACLELEGAKTVEKRQTRQRLFKNVCFPEAVMNVLKTSKLEESHREQNGYQTARLDLMKKCYTFLLACCKGNTEIKNKRVFADNMSMFVDHLDVKPFPPDATHKVELNAEVLVLELYDDNYALVQSATNDTIKRFVNLIVNNGRLPTWLQFLNKLAVVGGGDNVQPVKRNQRAIIKNLIQNKAKTLTPSLYRTEEEWTECVQLMEEQDEMKKTPTPGGLAYHIELIDLMYRCARGENKPAEQLCQDELPLPSIHRVLCDTRTVPAVKKAYLNFLYESYVELEKPKRAVPTSAEIWEILDKLAEDLLNSQLTMVGINSVEGNFRCQEEYVKLEIQYLYRDGLTFLTNWFLKFYNPHGTDTLDSWSEAVLPQERQQYMENTAKKLLDGVCTLLERPADPCCQISIKDTEDGYACVNTMMAKAGIRPSPKYDAVSKAFSEKGMKDRGDQFGNSGGVPPNADLIQLGFDVLATDFQAAVDPEVELRELATPLRILIKKKKNGGGDTSLLFGKPHDPHDTESESKWMERQAGGPTRYVRSLVEHARIKTEITGNKSLETPSEEVRRSLLVALKLLMEPADKDPKSVLEATRAKEEVFEYQKTMAGPWLQVPNLVFDMLRELPQGERRLAEAVLNLFRQQVKFGQLTVQKAIHHQLIIDKRRCEGVFSQLESRLTQGQAEAKTGSTRHALEATRAKEAAQAKAERNESNSNILAIEEAQEYTAPMEEALEHGYVVQIFQIMKDLCEDDNQTMKRFLAQQPTDSSFNLFVQAVQFIGVWQISMDAHNVAQGEYAFKALTELVIGPCLVNRETLISDLKMDTINGLFAGEAYSGPDGITREKTPFQAFVDRDVPGDAVMLCKVMCSCVRLLQAMLEGTDDPKDEAIKSLLLKTLEDLHLERFEDNILTIYKEYNLSFNPYERLQRKVLGLPPFDENKLVLGFLMLTLHRQTHDIKEERKKPIEFCEFYMGQKRYEVNASGPRSQKLAKEAENKEMEDAVQFFLNGSGHCSMYKGFKATGGMGRIEILRTQFAAADSIGPPVQRLERVYFKIPDICILLSQTSRDLLKNSVPRTSAEEKLTFFMERADTYHKEMLVQDSLNSTPLYTMLFGYKDTAQDAIYYIGGWLVNLMIIASVDHEDKFDSDPLANFDPNEKDGELGTPYNLADWRMPGGTRSLHIPNWHEIPVDHAQNYEKVAYMPVFSHYFIRYIGVVLLFLSSLTMTLFIMGNLILIPYDRFKQKHNLDEADRKIEDPNYESISWQLGMWDERKGKRLPMRLGLLISGMAFCGLSIFSGGITFGGESWINIENMVGAGIFGISGIFMIYCGLGAFVGQCMLYIMTDTGFLVQFFISLSCFLGYFWTEFAYAGLWFMILKDDELRQALKAVQEPISEIAKVLWLSMIIMYVSTVISFAFFHDHFNDGEQKEDNMCNGMLQCFVFTLYHGIISSEMWFAAAPADIWPTKRYDVQHDEETQNLYVFLFRMVFDILFFLVVGVTLIGGVLFGIILDKYAELREVGDNTNREHKNFCFICCVPREDFDKDGASGGFPMHVDDDHNLWNYIYFYVYLTDPENGAERTELNGPENYVRNQLALDAEKPADRNPFNVEWLPRYAAMVLEKQAETDMLDKTMTDVDLMTTQMEHMKRETLDLNDLVMQLLATAKIVEASDQNAA